ncbi:MAG: DUF3347 domain-containing protein [Ignavibacteriales bacterium]|nr:DUF3347 domain-containing protein [Ignavibacteriales bacterium]
MKNICVVIVLALVFVVDYGAVAIAQEEHQHHNKKDTAVDKTKEDAVPTSRDVNPKVAASFDKMVEHYLHLKNALVNDNSKDAAASGKEIVNTMKTLDKSLLTDEQKKIYEDVENDAREHAEHIGENAGKIEHQREHFDILSNDLYDLVKAFGSEKVLYKDFCPMYNDKEGAMWLSEIKEIKNPYYGKKMLTCGSVKEEIK